MKLRLLCLAVGALLATASVALADGTGELPRVLTVPQATGASCASLQRQFDQSIASHANAPKAATARHRRQIGEQSCNKGNYDDGVKNLVKALKDINVQPTMQ